MEKSNRIDLVLQNRMIENSKHRHTSNGVRSKLTSEEKKNIEQVSRQFEALFTYLVFKGMQKAMLSEFDETQKSTSFGGDILNDLGLMELTNYISKNGTTIGIADKLYQELTGEKLTHKDKISTITPSFKKPEEIRNRESKPRIGILNKALDAKVDTVERRISKFEHIINEVSKQYELPASLLKSVIAVESGGNPYAISPAGAKGLMQLIDSTANYVGVTKVFDPEENIKGGAKYLREMLDTFGGNLDLALAAYNAGPGNIFKYNGIPPFKETRNYVSKVKYYLSKFHLKGE